MSDEVDQTQDRLDSELELLRKYRKEIRPEAVPEGKCLNCGEPFTDLTLRWCDKDCEDDWEYRQRRKQ